MLPLISRKLSRSRARESLAAIVEIGAAASQSVTGDGASSGPTLAVEVTPIENRLELEAGVTVLFKQHSTEWSADLLFKKAVDAVEESGVYGWHRAGVDSFQTIQHRTICSFAGEVAADFMCRPSSGKHRFGWYVEPGYEYSFGREGMSNPLALPGVC